MSHDLMSEAGQQVMERERLDGYGPRPILDFDMDERIPFPVIPFDEPTPEEIAAMARMREQEMIEIQRWARELERRYPGLVDLDDAPALLRTQAI